MKILNKVKYLFVMVMVLIFVTSCKDDAVKPTLKATVTANELLTPSAAAYVLTLDNATKTMETFKWTVPNFGFAASVTYKLQMDKSTGDFSAPIEIATVSNGKTESPVSVGDMNTKLLGLGLNPEEAAAIKLRVVSTIGDKISPVVSTVKSITVTPYATSFPPIYGMGAGLKGWGPWPDAAVEWQSSAYKKYETIVYFTNNGEAFRFFAQADWNPVSYNFPFFTTVDSKFVNANDGDTNLKFIGTSGWYKVNVDLAAKKIAAVAVNEPVLYMTGAGIGGWDKPGTGASIKMTYVKPGVFKADATFYNDAFRFFAQADWSPTSYNYPFFTTVDPKFVNANDGDSNLKFIGTSGPFKITVDLNNKTVVVGDLPKPKLFMMGAALNGWGPWGSKEVEMTYVSAGVYKSTATFTSGEAFRFFAQADWGPTGYNYPYFTTVDAKFVNASDGDSNLKYVGATGSVNINVNLTTKVVSVN